MNHSEIASNDGRKQESRDRIIQGQWPQSTAECCCPEPWEAAFE